MRGSKPTIPIMMAVIMLTVTIADLPRLNSSARAQGVSALPWIPQALQAWGPNSVAVDFGARGLWSYNGSWVQLSRLDPLHMESWGDGYLAIDFGPYGLWTYDGQSWLKISL